MRGSVAAGAGWRGCAATAFACGLLLGAVGPAAGQDIPGLGGMLGVGFGLVVPLTELGVDGPAQGRLQTTLAGVADVELGLGETPFFLHGLVVLSAASGVVIDDRDCPDCAVQRRKGDYGIVTAGAGWMPDLAGVPFRPAVWAGWGRKRYSPSPEASPECVIGDAFCPAAVHLSGRRSEPTLELGAGVERREGRVGFRLRVRDLVSRFEHRDGRATTQHDAMVSAAFLVVF